MVSPDGGFSVTQSVFGRQELDGVLRGPATADLPRTKAGMRNALSVGAVRELASHSQMLVIARTFIGGQPIPFRATLFDKSVASNWLVAWHQDTALPVRQRVDDVGWGPWSTKGSVLHAIAPGAALATTVALRVHLDDSTEANGPLRVLPGTHAAGVLTTGEIQQLAAVVAPVVCVAPVGSVVAMRPLVVHASSKASDSAPRRILHIDYAASVHYGDGIELAVG